MPSGFVIRKNQYYDSVFLMGISKRISDMPGVQQNAVLMGSETNKGLLSEHWHPRLSDRLRPAQRLDRGGDRGYFSDYQRCMGQAG